MALGRRGPRCIYRPKDPPNITLQLSARVKRMLWATARRARESRSTIVEYLVRERSPVLVASAIGCCRPKVRPSVCVSLTHVAKVMLGEAAMRTGRTRSDVVEALIETQAARIDRQTIGAVAA